VVIFCAIVPVSGLCDCDNCPAANSTCSEKTVKSSCAPNCCLLISKITASDECSDNYCSCSCANPPSASISVSNTSILPNVLKMLVFAAFSTPTETVSKSVLVINTRLFPVFWLPVRLHLFLFVLLN
jgi:hypothetical protein